MSGPWVTAEEALRTLRVKPQTLYASVSRGRIRSRPDPADPRRSLYNRKDVDRLAERNAGRRPAETVAAEAISWGDAVLESGISTVAGGRLFYRGVDAVHLAETRTFEEVTGLLWQTAAVRAEDKSPLPARGERPVISRLLLAIADRAGKDAPTLNRSRALLTREAVSLLSLVVETVCGAGRGPVAARLAAAFGRPDAEPILERALILLADHELNASTFAARVAVSTGASLASGLLAGLATLGGPLHGGAAMAILPLTDRAERVGAPLAVREALSEGRPILGAGHPLYPQGDIRAKALLGSFELPPVNRELAEIIEDLVGERVNVDFALRALTATYDLPDDAPVQIFALARTAGWLAHMLEQAERGTLIRPRARYVGPAPQPSSFA